MFASVQRKYAVTAKGDYARENFQAEVTVMGKSLSADGLRKMPVNDLFPNDASARTWLPVAGEPDACDLRLALTLKEGQAAASGLAAAFDFAEWSTNNYVLIPAAVYNGNRYRTVGRAYATGLDPADYYRKDLPLTQTVVPRLEIESSKPSKLEVNACNVTTPALCVFDPAKKRGLIVLAEQAGRNASGDFLRKNNGEILDSAFAVEESADRSQATLVVSAPGVREQKPEFIGFSASPDRAIAWQPGDVVTLKLRVYSFATPDIPGLLEKFMIVRKAVTGPNHPRHLIPASQVEHWMTERIDSRFHDSPTARFYCPETAPWIAFGWVGGWMNTFPMLVLGDEKHLERVTHTFDYGLKAQKPQGCVAFLQRPKVELKAGETRIVHVTPEGRLD